MKRKIFVTSDTFLGRVEILDIAKRPFKDISEMNEVIVKNWNAVVGPNDIVYHLGNLAWTPLEAEELLIRLNGSIKLLMGDYDDAALEISRYLKDKIEIIPLAFYKEPKTNTILSHWEMANWPGKDKGIYHFHGHSLNTKKIDLNISRAINACTDEWNFKPIEILKSIELFKDFKKEINKTK
jgi:calcineurin-like phosphoesterase family protein